MKKDGLVPSLKNEKYRVKETEHGNHGIFVKRESEYGSYYVLLEEHGTYAEKTQAYDKMKELRLNTKSTSEKLNEKLTKLFGL